jgi:transcriptional regulator with XRE-family HTH domain/DNA-binding transcriptional regulator YiaG
MAEELGIHVTRLQTYEAGRVPVTNEVAQKFCSIFDVSQEWLAEGKGIINGAIVISPQYEAKMADCKLFSQAYDHHIKSSLLAQTNSLPPFISKVVPQLSQANISVQPLRTIPALGSFSSDKVLAVLIKVLKTKLDSTPACSRVQFRNHIISAAEDFSFNEKSCLTDVPTNENNSDVKAKLPTLLKRLNEATRKRGMKTSLAKFIGVPLSKVSEWLSGAHEPSGENTLRLLHWVEQQERQK